MKEKIDKNRQVSGITLVALVITVVILLILAGISIKLALGGDGILKSVQQAKMNHEIEKEKEEITLAVNGYNMAVESGKTEISLGEWLREQKEEQRLLKDAVIQGENVCIIIMPSKRGYKVTADRIEEVTDEEMKEYQLSILAPGLYDSSFGEIANWETLVKATDDGGYAMDITKAYTSSTYRTDPVSPYSILKNSRDLSQGRILVIGNVDKDGNEITSIGNYAFYMCSNLEKLVITSGITSIGNYAFDNCDYLSNVIIPDSITTIGSSCFQNCTSLENIKLPPNITKINTNTFRECNNLANVIIPENVTSIGASAFENCRSLTELIIPKKVRTVSSGAFKGCGGLNTIIVDENNTIFDNRDNCNAIIRKSTNQLILGCKNTVIPNTVTSIGGSAFYGCTGLTQITIPNNVTSIGSSAFEYCSGLTEITIPNNVTSIGSSVFAYCSGLTEITIPNTVTSIGNSAFINCSALTNINIPEGVTSIGTMTFEYCSRLTEITIPSSVTSIGSMAFQYCSGLRSVIIRAGITSISAYTFWGCSNLTSIELPDTIKTIENAAFRSCSNLEKVYIPSSVTTINGGSNVSYYSPFEGCKNVTIYCQNSYVPSGWCNTWNYINKTDAATTVMNYSVEDYRAQ